MVIHYEIELAFKRIFAGDVDDFSELKKLGLSCDEIEIGMIAGLLQLITDGHEIGGADNLIRDFLREHPHLLSVVVNSLDLSTPLKDVA